MKIEAKILHFSRRDYRELVRFGKRSAASAASGLTPVLLPIMDYPKRRDDFLRFGRASAVAAGLPCGAATGLPCAGAVLAAPAAPLAAVEAAAAAARQQQQIPLMAKKSNDFLRFG